MRALDKNFGLRCGGLDNVFSKGGDNQGRELDLQYRPRVGNYIYDMVKSPLYACMGVGGAKL